MRLAHCLQLDQCCIDVQLMHLCHSSHVVHPPVLYLNTISDVASVVGIATA